MKSHKIVFIFFSTYLLIEFHQSSAKLRYYEEINGIYFRQRTDKNGTASFILKFKAFNQTFKMYLHRKYFHNDSTFDLGQTLTAHNNQLRLYEGVLVNKSDSYVSGVLFLTGVRVFHGLIKHDQLIYQIDSPVIFNISTNSSMIIFRQSDVESISDYNNFCQTIPSEDNERVHHNFTVNTNKTIWFSKRQLKSIKYDYSAIVISPDFFEYIIQSYPSRNAFESIQIILLYVENMVWMTNSIYLMEADRIEVNLRLVLRKVHIISRAECKAKISSKSYKTICTQHNLKQIKVFYVMEKLFRVYNKFDQVIVITFRQDNSVQLGYARTGSYCKKNRKLILLNPYKDNLRLDDLSLGYVLTHEIGHRLGSGHDSANKNKACHKKFIMSTSFDFLSGMQFKFSPCSLNAITKYLKKATNNFSNLKCLKTKRNPPSVRCPGGKKCINKGSCKLIRCNSVSCKFVNSPNFALCDKGNKICYQGNCIKSVCPSNSKECSDGCFLKCSSVKLGCYFSMIRGKKVALPQGSFCKRGKGFCDYRDKCSPFKGNFASVTSTLASPCAAFRFLYSIKTNHPLTILFSAGLFNFIGIAIFLFFGNEGNNNAIILFKEEFLLWDFEEAIRVLKAITCRKNIWEPNHLPENATKDFCYKAVVFYLNRYPFLSRHCNIENIDCNHEQLKIDNSEFAKDSDSLIRYRNVLQILMTMDRTDLQDSSESLSIKL